MIQHQLVDLGRIRLHVATAGSGPPIMFLHGFPEFWYAWRKQLTGLSDAFRVIVPDLPGYNESDKPTGLDSYRIPALVETLVDLVEKLGASPLTVVGHDWGGALAWTLAALRPEIVHKLIIINMAHPAIFRRELTLNPAQQQASAYIQTFIQPTAEAILSENDFARMARAVFADGPFTAEDREAYRTAWRQPGALTAALNYYRAAPFGDDDYLRRMQTPIQVPTMVIWGEKDTYLLTGNLDGLEALVPHLRLHRFPDATHWIAHEHPQIITDLIRDFAT